MTRHCFQCGWEWTFRELPGRSETCPECRADLRVCVNCSHYDRHAAYQCRERRAEPVAEKQQANFCEHFDFAKRPHSGPPEETRAELARKALRSLLDD